MPIQYELDFGNQEKIKIEYKTSYAIGTTHNEQFRYWQDVWIHTKDKKAELQLWQIIEKCCTNMTLSYDRKHGFVHYAISVQDVARDATLRIFERLKRHNRYDLIEPYTIDKLSAIARLEIRHIMSNDKNPSNIVSYEEWIASKGEDEEIEN